MALLPRLALLAAVGIVAVALAPVPVAAVLLLDAALIVAVVLDLVRAASPRLITVEREVPAVLPVGQVGELVWRVGNPTSRTARVALADHPAPALRAAARRAAAVVAPGGEVRLATSIAPARRGRHRLDRMTVRVEGPWGLAARQSTRPLPDVVRSYPSLRSRREVELRIDRARILDVGLRSAKGRGSGTEFEQLRDYGPDDDHRRIDWAATARVGRPIVRTYREERNQPVIVMVDTGRTMATRVGDLARLEHSLDAALAVATVAARLGDRVGLVAFDREVRAVVAPRTGHLQLRSITEALHDLEPRLHESDPRTAFATVLTRFPRRGLLVLLTDLEHESASASLFPALPLVARRHVVLLGGVRDPLVDRLASDEPDTPSAVHLRAAALDVLEDRRRVRTALGRYGVEAIDAGPSELPGRLADAYLRVKATGRL